MARITFYGAAKEVTGSMHLVEQGGYRLLLDCGMKQGKRKEAFEKNREFPLDPASVNSIILTHAHIDHCGNIPTFMVQGFKGKVYSTHATRDLCELMLPDSAYVQMKDLEYVNKKRVKQGKAPFEPLYDLEQAEESLKLFVPKSIGEYFEVSPSMKGYFLNAGHILGSAMLVLNINDNGKEIKVGYTGDLGRKQLPILKDPDQLYKIDYLVMESTYGARDHKPIPSAYSKLAAIINDTYSRGGKMIVPVFAVERAQEMLYVLNKLFIENKIPAMPVFVDSPLTIRVTDVFRSHSECFDDDMLKFIAENNNPFYLELVQYTQDVEESKKINEYKQPCIILSATGMCEAGRILHHLKNNVDDPKNTVLFVGYQAVNTLGRMIMEGQRDIKIFGEPHRINAQVKVINEFSGHAGSSGLVTFAKKAAKDGRLKKVFLVHGEPEQQEELAAKLLAEGIKEVIIPDPGRSEALV